MRPSPRRLAVATGLLTVTLLRRFFREGLVLRSLLFPLVIAAGALVATLGAVAYYRAPPIIGVTPGFSEPGFDEALAEQHLRVIEVDDAEAAVAARQVVAATDGERVWSGWPSRDGFIVESVLRRNRPGWQLDPIVDHTSVAEGAFFGAFIGRLIGGIFALYGVVVGAAMIARDRDDGTLHAEMALPIPRWVLAAARWFAATLVLMGFFVPTLTVFAALMGVPEVASVARHGVAASATSSAIGIAMVSRPGPKGGFGGPLAAGLAITFGLFALGRVFPGVGAWVPVASLGTTGDGWWPLAASGLAGTAAVALFAARSRT